MLSRTSGGRTNDRPGTDHVISGPMKGLEENFIRWRRQKDRQTKDTHMDMATLWLNPPSGVDSVKIKCISFEMEIVHSTSIQNPGGSLSLKHGLTDKPTNKGQSCIFYWIHFSVFLKVIEISVREMITMLGERSLITSLLPGSGIRNFHKFYHHQMLNKQFQNSNSILSSDCGSKWTYILVKMLAL